MGVDWGKIKELAISNCNARLDGKGFAEKTWL